MADVATTTTDPASAKKNNRGRGRGNRGPRGAKAQNNIVNNNNTEDQINNNADAAPKADENHGESRSFFSALKRNQPSAPNSSSDCSWKNAFGYIGLFGPSVEAAAHKDRELVPESYIKSKEKRDGRDIHHITLMIKSEIKHSLESMKHVPYYADYSKDKKGGIQILLNIIADRVVDDWVDHGLGCVRQGNNEAYFKVISWPSASQLRADLGLKPKDFHITIGFKSADIHDVCKGLSTLVVSDKKEQGGAASQPTSSSSVAPAQAPAPAAAPAENAADNNNNSNDNKNNRRGGRNRNNNRSAKKEAAPTQQPQPQQQQQQQQQQQTAAGTANADEQYKTVILNGRKVRAKVVAPATTTTATAVTTTASQSKKVLYILRGISGSGKSTLAQQIKSENGGTGVILSTDEYFIRKDTGVYEFNPKMLGKAHEWNQKRASDAMRNGTSLVIIDNTNTCKWEAKPYVEEALACGYEIIIREPDTPWAKNAEELAKKNTHNVPIESIRSMLQRWETDFTVENILKSQPPNRRRASSKPHKQQHQRQQQQQATVSANSNVNNNNNNNNNNSGSSNAATATATASDPASPIVTTAGKTLHSEVLKNWTKTGVVFNKKQAMDWINCKPASDTPQDLLRWAEEHPFLKVVKYRIPDGIISECPEAYLIDIAAKPPRRRRGMPVLDDDVYDLFPHVRAYIPRGCALLELVHGPGKPTETRIVIYAMKKFTGGPGDDDDLADEKNDKQGGESGDCSSSSSNNNSIKARWEHYFLEPASSCAHIIKTSKENGEASHFAEVRIERSSYFVFGSKHVHLLAKNEEDVAKYTETRFTVARGVALTMLKQLKTMNQSSLQNFLNYMNKYSLTATFEFLQVDYQHVEHFEFDSSRFRFIAFTSNRDLARSLCSDDIENSVQIARKAGFDTMQVSRHPYAEQEALFESIRQGYGKEGAVLYYVNKSGKVIGMVKKKTIWYILVRSLREKAKSFTTRVLEAIEKASSDNADTNATTATNNGNGNGNGNNGVDAAVAAIKDRFQKKIKDTLRQKQDWLGFSRAAYDAWVVLGQRMLDWLAEQLKAKTVTANEVASLFPPTWKRFLNETGLVDKIDYGTGLHTNSNSNSNSNNSSKQ